MDEPGAPEVQAVPGPSTNALGSASPRRRDTASSANGAPSSAASNSSGTSAADTCRICRSEGSAEEPLFYPCKCSGSIKYVHQECLMEWLSHSHKKHCELCKTPFRFTKLYDAHMPEDLPWALFVKQAALHMVRGMVMLGRGVLVATVWLISLPWLVRWAWRWMFWVADAGWARETWIAKMLESQAAQNGTYLDPSHRIDESTLFSDALAQVMNVTISPADGLGDAGPAVYNFLKAAFRAAFATSSGLSSQSLDDYHTTTATAMAYYPEASASLLSNLSYLSTLTPSPAFNRLILDIMEGQLITCVVITGFILIFLIREWVVQQQPLVAFGGEPAQQAAAAAAAAANVDGLMADLAQLQEMAQRVERDNERLQRRREAIERAMERFPQLRTHQGDAEVEHTAPDESQVEGADPAGSRRRAQSDPLASRPTRSENLSEASATQRPEPQRPRMPERDISTQTARIHRLLGDAEGMLNSRDNDRGSQDVVSPNDGAEMSTPRPTKSEGDTLQGLVPHSDFTEEELPITNAGPDAKINIKRSGKGKARAVPEPKDATPQELAQRKAEDEAIKKQEQEIEVGSDAAVHAYQSEPGVAAETAVDGPGQIDNPFHPDGTLPAAQTPGSIVLDGIDALAAQGSPLEAFDSEGNVEVPEEQDAGDDVPAPRPAAQPSRLQRLTDWFWDGIPPQNAGERAPVLPDEERLEAENLAHGAPFVPIAHDGQPEALAPHVGHVHHHNHPDQDAEVLEAARAAGIDPANVVGDAEALEEAEDLEGVFELIGLRGPLLGLVQTSSFCSVLVTGTVFGTVGLPYVWGKLVLSFVGSPVWILVTLPMQILGVFTDVLIDCSVVLGGYCIVAGLICINAIFGTIGWLLEYAAGWQTGLSFEGSKYGKLVVEFAIRMVEKAGMRLSDLVLGAGGAVAVGSENEAGLNWAFLAASVHAHSSLKVIQAEVSTIMDWTGRGVTTIVETISSGAVTATLKHGLYNVSVIPNKLIGTRPYYSKFLSHTLFALDYWNPIRLLHPPTIPLDAIPDLIFWSTTDRTLTVAIGYASLALLAAVYVALDTPVFARTEAGRKTEKALLDTLRQAGGVLKVILIISIEMLVFPFYCGVLLDIAFLPLFQDATLAARWAWAGQKPGMFCFVHWFLGTCYMFHFALFVGMCRKILRKGVLWFIRDPDDPTFHPVRDVLERNVTTQLRKIAFSALVYGALVILCLGGVIWSLGRLAEGIFPIGWVSTDPILEFPCDLLLFNVITPLVLHLLRPSEVVSDMYAWWLRRCARALRLSHFLFDDRRKDEEGQFLRRRWIAFFKRLRTTAIDDVDAANTAPTDSTSATQEDGAISSLSDTVFRKDGKYVLTPCNDQYRPPRPGEAFIHYADDKDGDVYIMDADGKRNDHFAKVYVPPSFRLRITAFMVGLWMFSAALGLCGTLVPLVLGRKIIAGALGQHERRLNDIYAYAVGSYILGALLLGSLRWREAMVWLRDNVGNPIQAKIDAAQIATKLRSWTLRALKCAYVYGFLGVALPMIFAMVLQFYLILPLHTYSVSHAAASSTFDASTNTTTVSSISTAGTATNSVRSFASLPSSTPQPPTFASHTIYLLQDYCLGLLYTRLAGRYILAEPASRPAEVWRRIIADGYLNPDVRLATRYLIAPVTLFAAVALLLPPLCMPPFNIIWQIQARFHTSPGNVAWLLDPETQTKLYRYSYPMFAAWVVFLLCGSEILESTGRWRARIRDEVYLVGERLHNFGERQPPVGSRSVVRRDR